MTRHPPISCIRVTHMEFLVLPSRVLLVNLSMIVGSRFSLLAIIAFGAIFGRDANLVL